MDFADASKVFAGPHFEDIDDRFDYDEDRYITVGLLDGTVVIMVWTPRDDGRRIISMRKANGTETAIPRIYSVRFFRPLRRVILQPPTSLHSLLHR